MDRISRSMLAGLCLLGSAACAADGITAPQVQPRAAPLAAAAPAPEPAAAPEAAPRFIIRCGRSTPPSTGQPLYVVDGIIRESVDVEALDIEQIELLKDAAAAARYGSRAANGVVLITTRSARP